MKTYYSILVFVGCVLTFFSCQRDEIMVYEYETTGVQLFFDYAYQGKENYLRVSFGYDKVPKTDTTVRIPVRFMGIPVDYDREFKYKVEYATCEENVNYQILTSEVLADSVRGYLNLKLYNTPELYDTTYIVSVKLIENENFGINYPISLAKDEVDPLLFYVLFDSNNEIPNLWAAYTNRFESYCFGPYSNVKFNFILQTLGLERSYFEYDPETETAAEVFTKRFPSTTLIATLYSWCAIMNNALDEYEREHGYRLVDENGEEVTMRFDYK